LHSCKKLGKYAEAFFGRVENSVIEKLLGGSPREIGKGQKKIRIKESKKRKCKILRRDTIPQELKQIKTKPQKR